MNDQTQQVTEKIWTRDFVFLCFGNFFIFAAFQMTLPTLPLFVNELGGNDQLIGFIVGIFTFSALLIRPWSGRSLETKGRRIVYLLGLLIFVLSVAIYSITSTIIVLLLMRIVQGFGWGMLTTAGGTIATDLIPPKRRGEGMGYFGLSSNLAMAFGPALGLLLITVIDFPLTFLIAAILGIVSLAIVSFIKYSPVNKELMNKQKKWDVFEPTALVPATLLFFITMVFGGITSFLPLYAIEEGVSGIGWYFFVFAISLMLVRSFAGRIYDRKGHRAVFIPGTLLIIGSMINLIYLSNEWMLITAAFLFGTGFGTVLPALQAWAVQEAPKNRRGMANATFFSAFDLGVGFGAIFFGFIASKFGYSEIYIAASISVSISILIYVIYLKKYSTQMKQREVM